MGVENTLAKTPPLHADMIVVENPKKLGHVPANPVCRGCDHVGARASLDENGKVVGSTSSVCLAHEHGAPESEMKCRK